MVHNSDTKLDLPDWFAWYSSKAGRDFCLMHLVTYMFPIYVWMGDSTPLSVAVRRFILDLAFTHTSPRGHETWEGKKKGGGESLE